MIKTNSRFIRRRDDYIGDRVPTLSAPEIESSLSSIPRSKYYLSSWDSNEVVLDISSDRAGVGIMKLSLDDITINCDGPMSPLQGVVGLNMFSHLIDASKAYLNVCIETFSTSTKVRSEVMQNFNNILRFISWMIKFKGVHKFSDLSRDDFYDFAISFSTQGGWSGIHGYHDLLRTVLACLENDLIDVGCVVSPDSSKKRRLSINEISLQSHLGIPIPMSDVPVWFYERLSSFTGLKHRSARQQDMPNTVSRMNLYNVFKSLNRLSDLPDKWCPKVFPIPNASKFADKLATKHFQGRTKNLSLDVAIDLFSMSTKWIYEYSPVVLDAMTVIRSKLEQLPKSSSKSVTALLFGDSDVQFALKKLAGLEGSPFDCVVLDIHCQGHDSIKCPALIEIVATLMSACFIMVAMNHGRRLNEIVGTGSLTYGLYFGCIKTSQEHLDTHFIDIYVEKTVKDWCFFYVNKLIVDAVQVMESMSQVFRPLFAPKKLYNSNLEEARKDKLFIMRKFSFWGFETKPFHFNFSKHSRLFFHMANSDLSQIDFRAHPFRRFFSLLYYYRHDNPKLIALQDHLCHFDPGMTLVYVTDPNSREAADRIEILYMNRINEMSKKELKEIDDVRSEAFSESIFELLKGKRTGGNWPSVILPLYQQLLLNAEFDELDIQSAAHVISRKLLESGYSRTAFPHGGCNVGDSYRTKKISKCFSEEDQEVHLEHASPSFCMNCIHFDQGESNLKLIEQSILDMLEECRDIRVPIVIKNEMMAEAALLKSVVRKERRLAGKNRKAIHSIVGAFACALGDEGKQ